MKKSIIVIIEYDTGNIRSIINKIDRYGFKSIVTSDHDTIIKADKLILPGVGNFQKGMMNLRQKNLINILNKKVILDKVPILGICLGMQLFTQFSEEGSTEGLGWIDAKTVRFCLNDVRHKVPHMGWNSLQIKKDSQLFNGISANNQYYFVHSYHVNCNTQDDILATTFYGYEFVSAIQRHNIFGTQFHPEKSHEGGEMIIRNFLRV